MIKSFFEIFPLEIKRKIESVGVDKVQEIRIRINKPIIVYIGGNEIILDKKINKDEMKYIIQRISNYSIYAYEEEIKQGFITLKGGHRVGLAGECVADNDGIKTIKNISSLNIRISREVIGCSRNILKYIVKENKVRNTLIISPPKCGKTTMLRDITRVLSNGDKGLNITGKKVAVVDERSEIGGSYQGVPQMDLGIRTDILDNCPKKDGMIMAIRSLSPEVLICDEIGNVEDIKALKTAFNSGVSIVVTVHGDDYEEVKRRCEFKELFDSKIIKNIVVLGNKKNIGDEVKIYSLDCEEGLACLRL